MRVRRARFRGEVLVVVLVLDRVVWRAIGAMALRRRRRRRGPRLGLGGLRGEGGSCRRVAISRRREERLRLEGVVGVGVEGRGAVGVVGDEGLGRRESLRGSWGVFEVSLLVVGLDWGVGFVLLGRVLVASEDGKGVSDGRWWIPGVPGTSIETRLERS